MKCNICGEGVAMTGDNGGTSPGNEFVEYHECANGHTGTIRGVVGQPVDRWQETGCLG